MTSTTTKACLHRDTFVDTLLTAVTTFFIFASVSMYGMLAIAPGPLLGPFHETASLGLFVVGAQVIRRHSDLRKVTVFQNCVSYLVFIFCIFAIVEAFKFSLSRSL